MKQCGIELAQNMPMKMNKIYIFLFIVLISATVLSFGCSDGFMLEQATTNITPGSTDIPVNEVFVVDFSEPIIPETAIPENIYIPEGDTSSECQREQAIETEVLVLPNSLNRRVQITPTTFLKSNTSYSLCVTSRVKYADNTDYEGLVVSFTTADTEGPIVQSILPADGATNVPVNMSIQAFFNEALNPLTVDSSTFVVSAGGIAFSGQLHYNSITHLITFTPDSNFASFTTYDIDISGIADRRGNVMDSFNSSFTTSDIVAPTVASTIPTSGEIDYPVDGDITATFNENMDQSTINTSSFTLEKTAGGAVSSSVSGINNQATLTPNANLDFFTSHTVKLLAADITDISGNHLASDVSWNFTTESTYYMKTYGDVRTDSISDVKSTSDMGFIAAGYVNDGATNSDLWLTKLDFAGNVLWGKKMRYGLYSETASHFDFTSDGGYIVGGNFTSNTSPTMTDMLVAKFASDGSPEWQKTYGHPSGSNTRDQLTAIRATSDNGYIIAGNIDLDSTVADTWRLWVLKLTSTGTITWQKYYYFAPQYASSATDIIQTSDGGYAVAGWYSVTTPNFQVWVLKLNSDGTIAWQKAYGGNTLAGYTETASAIRQTADGGYIVAGQIDSEGAGGSDIWLVKLDSSGNIETQWAYGGANNDSSSALMINSNGNYVVSGSTLSFVTSSGGWALEINKDTGIPVWENSFGTGSSNSASSVTDVVDGGYAIGGSTFQFGNPPYANAWLLKLNSTGSVDSCSYINPTSATVTITTAPPATTTTATDTGTSAAVNSPVFTITNVDNYLGTQCITP